MGCQGEKHMSVVKSLEDLGRIRDEALEKRKTRSDAGKAQISIAMGTCSIAAGARETMKAMLDEIKLEKLSDIVLTQTGCIGLCEEEPTVQVQIGRQPQVTYGKVTPDIARQIVKEHLASGNIVQKYKIAA
jgi:NADP-reducing hydrogenase subunit HndB